MRKFIPFHTFHLVRRRCDSGAALVIILAFIVLLTVLVMAYFSYSTLQRQISQASVNRAGVEMFALGAINTILSDFKQEIAGGSTNSSYGTNQVHIPLLATNAVPSRVGTADTLPNLVKRSVYGQAFSLNGISRAANVSSTNSSQNGRFLSPARWNAALLLPKANTNSATDLSPLGDFTPPDWILVARDGSNPTAWNNNMRASAANPTTVIGRYAYAIYDEGGLLDVNAAGYPPGSSTDLTAHKGILASAADLTVIPGMTATAASALVGWRNYASSLPDGSFPSYTFTDTSRTNYFRSVRDVSSGFLRTANTNIVSSQSDRLFVSRQQLIQFLTQGIATTAAEIAPLQTALQYLGTFCREKNAPSWKPSTPAGSTVNYAANAETAEAINRNFPAVRVAKSFTRFDGASAQIGDPLVNRRFPLSRLAWVASTDTNTDGTPGAYANGPANGATAENIKKIFGLAWNNSRWVYTSPDEPGTIPATAIRTLDDVANQGREPDFFEILKAGILYGSLGKKGPAVFNWNSTSGGWAYGDTQIYDGIADYQILSIGASMIDQADADHFPTTIYFGSNDDDSDGQNGIEVYGIEDLPYLMAIASMTHRLATPATAVFTATEKSYFTPSSTQTVAGPPPTVWWDPNSSIGKTYSTPYAGLWFLPILWNPHQQQSDSTTRPAIRVVASGGNAQGYIQWRNGWGNPPGYVDINYNMPVKIFSPSVSEVQLTPNASDFREPDYTRPPQASSSHPEDIVNDTASFAALYVGRAFVPWGFSPGNLYDTTDTLKRAWWLWRIIPSNVTFEMQWQDTSGNWHPYNRMKNQLGTTALNLNPAQSTTVTGTLLEDNVFGVHVRPDPRTDRFSTGFCWSYGKPANNPAYLPPNNSGLPLFRQTVRRDTGQGTSMFYWNLPIATPPLSASPGWTWPNADAVQFHLTSGDYAENKADSPVRYTDPDGVQRRADGAYASGSITGTTYSGGNSAGGYPMAQVVSTGTNFSRPIILDRPFRSVGELGYVFRDMPWKTLDFFTPESGDAGLLDLFCTGDDVDITGGRFNLNTRNVPVLESILVGAGINSLAPASTTTAGSSTLTATHANTLATTIVNSTIVTPLINRSELATRASSANSLLATLGFTDGQAGKTQRETVVRALAEAGSTRTWNLLIDLVAQTGRYTQNANGLAQFTVEGELRCWLHVAIDRYTGEIIAQQLEPVYE